MTQPIYSAQRDLTATVRAPGPGCAPMFLCAACGNKKGSQGRKLARVHGLRTWVCASCAKGKA
jgi:hypothetical protein